MKNVIRTKLHGGKKTQVPQVQTGNEKPACEPQITNGTYQGQTPICLTLADSRADAILAGIDITPRQLKALRDQSSKQGKPIAELLRTALQSIITAPTPKRPKIHKNFVLVNLSMSEQKELGSMANETGLALRDSLRHALIQVRQDLQSRVRIKRLTGLNSIEQFKFFGCFNNVRN